MKVSMVDFKKGLVLFTAEFINSLSLPCYKMLAGMKIRDERTKIDAKIAARADENGMIDVDEIREIVNEGLKYCGGEFEVPLDFGLLGHDKIKITRDDLDKFFDKTLPSVSPSAVQ